MTINCRSRVLIASPVSLAVSYTHLDVYKRQGIWGYGLWASEVIIMNV